ncbi:MAG: M20/M25/M40 family metallo-hydrolase [Spirochaetales bacterium]|nr:M20/M25/M40 family metallo-hydrolase [Spirochaetales bacterium]
MQTVTVLMVLALGILSGTAALALARALSGGGHPARPPLDRDSEEDFTGAAEDLAALIRFRTVSWFEPDLEDGEAFASLPAELARRWPLVMARTLRREAGDRAILLEWPGSDSTLAPLVLAAHWDVVPPGDGWSFDPFSAGVEGDEIRGRGAQDTKVTMAAILGACERLARAGWTPHRTIFLAFGGDEETGGTRGARRMAEWFRERGLRAACLLDEGGIIADGMLSFVDRPLALIGTAEKGYLDATIETLGSGGHASMPPRSTAAGGLARAVSALERRPFPARLVPTARAFLGALSDHAPFGYRLLFRNLWLFGPLVIRAFSRSPTTDALVRTTMAFTMLEGSPKENVLPERARANVNVRILPGETIASALARLDRIARRRGARAYAAHEGSASDPSPETPPSGPAWDALAKALSSTRPDAGMLPFLFSAGTDTKHWVGVADSIYRFAPILQTPADLARVHGRDERVAKGELRKATLFYREFMKAYCGPDGETADAPGRVSAGERS